MTYNPALIPHIPNVAALLALPANYGAQAGVIYLDGYYAANDGGGGVLEWSGSSSATENNGTIFKPTAVGVGTGRWIRQCDREYSVLWFGAKNDNTDAAQSFILAAQTAVAAAGGGTVYYPPGTYNITGMTNFVSNVNHVGVRGQSTLKIGSATAFYIFNKSAAGPAPGPTVENVTFDGLTFDGSLNYPADSTVYKQTYALSNAAIRTGNVTAVNLVIKNCMFNSLSESSIDINGIANTSVTIEGNYFYKASYKLQAINIRLPANPPFTYSQRNNAIKIVNNTLNICGPQYYYNASKEDWIASTDAISLYGCRDCLVSNNTITNAAGGGIRIEASIRVTVSTNNIVHPGTNGITVYNASFNCTITGNTVFGWGTIPNAFTMQNYLGSYYQATEFMKSTGPTLPANPSASVYFIAWRYSLDLIDTGTVVAYSNTNYYTTGPTGILPFRGYSGIVVQQLSKQCTVTGNVCIGDLETDGSGDYKCASNFGFSPIDSVNAPTDGAGDDCVIMGNVFLDCLDYQIYHPEFEDPNAGAGVMGFASYIGNVDNISSLIDKPIVWINNGGSFKGTKTGLFYSDLPTADPATVGEIYTDGVPSVGTPQTLKVSGG